LKAPTYAGSGPSGSSPVLSGIFIAKEIDQVGDKGSGDSIIVDVRTLFKTFFNMSLRSASFNNEVLFWHKAKLPVLRLSGFPNYPMSGYKNFAVFNDISSAFQNQSTSFHF
jgi:hypothetical protein